MEPSSALGTGIAVAGGSISVATVIVGIIVWSLKRNVQHEDDAKKDFKTRLSVVEKQQMELSHEVKGLHTSVNEMTGALSELKRSTEVTRDKMAEHYREALKELETRMVQRFQDLQTAFRSDLTRALDPSLNQRISKLEEEVRELRPRKRGRG